MSFFFDKAALSFIGLIKNWYLGYFFNAVTNFWSVAFALMIGIEGSFYIHEACWYKCLPPDDVDEEAGKRFEEDALET